jgi:hypothetical protein
MMIFDQIYLINKELNENYLDVNIKNYSENDKE